MAVDPSVKIDIAAEFTGKKAFDKASKSTSKLESTVGSLGKKMALAFSATAVLKFAKDSIKAFADDEKSAAILANTMKNLGLEFQNPAVEQFITKMQAATGELDDNLRPAMQKLLQVTGSVAQSQELMTLALDVSAGSGVDLQTVVSDLAAAHAGNTKGLKKYALGLTAAQLKTIKFTDVTDKLGKTFKGSAAEGAKTLTGQMKILTAAAGEAKETIGGGLVEAFRILAGDNGITDMTSKMADFAKEVSDTVVGLALLINKLKDIPLVGSAFTKAMEHQKDILSFLIPGFRELADVQKYLSDLANRQTKPFSVGMSVTGATDYYDKQARALAKAEADALAKRIAAEKKAAATKVKTDKSAAIKDAALKKAAATFDLNKIQIAAALKATYDKDERLRLLAMQALEEDNGEAALSYIKQLNILTAEQQTNKLAGIKTISENELNYINQLLLDELQRIKTTKMSEEEAAAARQAAYAKYNAAIQQSGGLAEANFYTEKTQAELLAIAKLAALDKVAAAQATMDILNYNSQITIIDKIAAAQKLADDAKYKALQDYLALLAAPLPTPATPPQIMPPGFGGGGQPIPPGYGGYFDYMPAGLSSGSTASNIDNSVVINIEGMIDTGNFDEVVNQAMINAQRKGYSQYAAGSLP